MSKAQTEKRGTRRVAAKRKARVKMMDGVLHEIEGRTRDVSIRGVFVYLQKKVAAGSTLEVVLPLPEGVTQAPEQWVRCKCRVVRVEDVQNGKEFGVAAVIEDFEPLAEARVGRA